MENDFMKRIVVNPKVMVGKPVIRGTRVTVHEIVARVADGWTFTEIMDDLEIAKEDIQAALLYAGHLVEGEDVFPVVIGTKHEISH